MRQAWHHLRLITVPLTVCVRVDCELAAASASSIVVLRGMMPGSVVAVTCVGFGFGFGLGLGLG